MRALFVSLGAIGALVVATIPGDAGIGAAVLAHEGVRWS